jgi:hypothetical protein
MDIEVFVEGEGLDDVQLITLPAGTPARSVVEWVAKKSGFPAAEGLLFLEDEETPLDLKEALISDAYVGCVHHVHRQRAIDVHVYFGGREIDRQFSPATRIQRVLDWAVGPKGFRIDPPIAPEMELALHGTTEALPKKAHIGRLVRPPKKKLELDLIRGVIPNGFGA